MKRKRKLKLIPFIVILIILIVIGFLIYKTFFNQVESDYNSDALNILKKYNRDSMVSKMDYSKTLDAVLASGQYKDEYFNEYLNINYQDTSDFVLVINTLLDKEYTADEINNIYSKFREDNITKIMNKEYLDLADFFAISNYDADNHERYLAVALNSSMDLSDIVTYVNIGLDKTFYSEYDEIQNIDSYQVLVNKYHKLPESYEPNDLVLLKGIETANANVEYKLRKVAAEAFLSMYNDAKNANHLLIPFSAYRSFNRQNELYAGYVNRDGAEVADNYSARPGFSEHQTGLAIDIQSSNKTMSLNDSDYDWVLKNSYKYGFIIRYPQGKISITGYMYEDWHLRYIGVTHATKLNELNITFDEYYDLYLK